MICGGILMRNEMNLTRENYYKSRRWYWLINRNYNKSEKPGWMVKGNDKRFTATFRDEKLLFTEGKIMLGRIVQANSLLFEAGPSDCPAAMLFTDEPFFEENPLKLQEIAYGLFDIKGKDTDDDELQKFSDILYDEYVAAFNVEVPSKITYGKKVYFTSFMVHRKHLPLGYIDIGCFPILACPEKTEASIILPSKYWTPGLKSCISQLE